MPPMLLWKWCGGGGGDVYAYVLTLYELIIIYT